MNPLSRRVRWAALCLASLFAIGIPAALQGLAKSGDTPRVPAGVAVDADWELEPKRPC
jgi:hypothetical protein